MEGKKSSVDDTLVVVATIETTEDVEKITDVDTNKKSAAKARKNSLTQITLNNSGPRRPSAKFVNFVNYQLFFKRLNIHSSYTYIF